MRKLKIGFVGCGEFADLMAFFARVNPRIQITACCDIDLDTAASFARKHRIALSTEDYAHLLQSDIDAVYLPIPHALHHEYIRSALHAGKHVFSEKPLCLTTTEVKDVIQLAQEKGLTLCVNFLHRYASSVQQAKRRPLSGHHLFTTVHIPWHRNADYIAPDNWHARKAMAGGGTLITQGIHALDIALRQIPNKPISVYTTLSNHKFLDIETEDLAAAHITFDNDSVLHLVSTMAARKEEAATITTYTTKGRQRIRLPQTLGFVHAAYRSLDAFAQHIRRGQLVQHLGSSVLDVTKVVEAAYQSGEEGRPVIL